MCPECVHMWYIQSEIKTKDYFYINVDFKPSKEWQFKRVDAKEERERENTETRITYIEVRVFYPFDALIWVIYIRTHTCCKHTHTHKQSEIDSMDKMLGHRKWREKYPSTNFKISDKLYAWASVIGLELHKTLELPAIGASMSVQFVTWLFFLLSSVCISIIMSSGGVIAVRRWKKYIDFFDPYS